MGISLRNGQRIRDAYGFWLALGKLCLSFLTSLKQIYERSTCFDDVILSSTLCYLRKKNHTLVADCHPFSLLLVFGLLLKVQLESTKSFI